MSASSTITDTHIAWKREAALPSVCTLSLLCATGSAADVQVVTDREHPISATSPVRVIELDAPMQLLESELAAHLPADPRKAEVIARRRLSNEGAVLQNHLAVLCLGVIEAWTLGIAKIPAVVVDRRYVVYGERDVDRAVSLIERYRSTHP